jgi:hypothetical protein
MIRSVPAFAREQLAAFCAPVRRSVDLLHVAEPEHLKADTQGPSRRRSRVSERARRSAAGRLAVAGVALSLSGCATEPRPPVPGVPGLDVLAAQAERLDARREFALDAAAACRQACLTEPASLVFHGDRVECRCRKAPSLGVHRLPRTSSSANARVAAAHGSALSQALRGAPGAARGEDRADAGSALSPREEAPRG